ncbi:MAG: hypothetical protein H8E85_06985 [Candidatus Marinimicrobia bacterium]|nr:hypothetical protein [Candidatus Neomarinimicrobiota bacterium]
MNILTQIPIGSKLKVQVNDEIVTLVEICFYPTRYKTTNESGKINYYRTHEVVIVESEEKSD